MFVMFYTPEIATYSRAIGKRYLRVTPCPTVRPGEGLAHCDTRRVPPVFFYRPPGDSGAAPDRVRPVRTRAQNDDSQLDDLEAAECERIFAERVPAGGWSS